MLGQRAGRSIGRGQNLLVLGFYLFTWVSLSGRKRETEWRGKGVKGKSEIPPGPADSCHQAKGIPREGDSSAKQGGSSFKNGSLLLRCSL